MIVFSHEAVRVLCVLCVQNVCLFPCVCDCMCFFYPACFYPHFNDDEAVVATFVDGF